MAYRASWNRLVEWKERVLPTERRSFTQWVSGISGKSYKATHPVNALLNYVYTVHAARLERALTLAGLDARAGTLRVDSDGRTSAAWDVLELLRAKLDKQTLARVRTQRWRHHDFDVDDDRMVALGMNVSRGVRYCA